jgi:hypothetical protein
MEPIVGSIIVAGLGGLTVLAYKHPEGYAELVPWVVALPAAAVFSLGVFQLGGLNLWVRIMDFIPDAKRAQARAVYDRFITPDFAVVLIIWCLFEAYLVFLVFLPSLTKKKGAGGDEGGASEAP